MRDGELQLCLIAVITEIRIFTQFIIARQEVISSDTRADMTNECVRRVGVDTVGLQPSSFILRGWSVVSYCVFSGVSVI